MINIDSQEYNIDLNRGRKEYESKVKNIEGIFSKLNGILDITKYKKEFNEIIKECENDPSLSKKMTSSNMQMDYEGFVYNKYTEKLNDLTKRLESEILPFYELYLLCNKIQESLKNISGENISDVIIETKKLINSLNKLNTHNKKEKNSIIDLSYKVIYSVILYEEIFDRSDILSYIKQLNIPINIENIGRLLSKDLDKIDKKELIEEDLKSLQKEGLGYDYLDEKIIRKVSNKTVGEKNSEYQERKRQTIDELLDKVSTLEDEKNDISLSLKNNKFKLKELYKRKNILVSKMLSLILVPVVTISAGHTIGKLSSEKITEYKTITRTVDANTGKIIGEVEEIYDEHATTYVATILEQSPWKKNPNGGYTRTVTAYEYHTPENIDENYHVSNKDIEGNITEKYKYVEAKEELDSNDSLTDTTILVTETFQDKSVSRKSTKYILPFTITASILSLLFDLAVLLVPALGYENAKRILENLNNEIKDKKLTEEEIKERILKLKEYALKVQKEYNDALIKYGSLGEKFIFEPIDTTDIKSFTKSLKITK